MLVTIFYGAGFILFAWLQQWKRFGCGHEMFDKIERLDLHCPVCGYSLIALVESRCPECGAQFTLDVLLAR